MGERIATLAEVRDLRLRVTAGVGDGVPSKLAKDIEATCATVERLAEALSTLRTLCIKEGHLLDESTDWVTTLDDTRALLTQLGATP